MYSKIDIIILGLLSNKPSHGYELNRHLAKSPFQKILKISPISIYKGLERLARKGLIEPRTEKIGKMPERIVYQLNSTGYQELKKQTSSLLANGIPSNFDIYAALLFMNCLGKDETISALKERKETINTIIAHLENNISRDKWNWALPFTSISQHLELHYTTELEWTNKTVRKIQNSRKWPQKGGEFD